MRRGAAIAAGILLLGLGGWAAASLGPELWEQTRMKKLSIVLYVTDEVIEKGAVVNVLVRKVPVDLFEAAYPVDPDADDVPGAAPADRQWYGTVSGPLNFVYFEVPDDFSYTYNFRKFPAGESGAARVKDTVIGVAGMNLDAQGNEIGAEEFNLVRSHEIEGALMTAASAFAGSDSDFQLTDAHCTDTTGVRVCIPDDAQLIARMTYFSRSSSSIEPGHPWGR